MFKARPPSGNSLEAVPTRRTALPAARLLAVLAALALVAALFGVPAVQGQTATVLVKNTEQTLSTFNATLNNDGQKRAQGFTTGTNDEGYTLSSIGFRFKNVAETAAASKLTATLTEESSGNPGSDLCTLTNPTIAANAVNTFTAPTSCPILAANTTYFFVLERSDASGNSIGVNLTSSGNQDSTPATGWSISDDRHPGIEHGPLEPHVRRVLPDRGQGRGQGRSRRRGPGQEHGADQRLLGHSGHRIPKVSPGVHYGHKRWGLHADLHRHQLENRWGHLDSGKRVDGDTERGQRF